MDISSDAHISGFQSSLSELFGARTSKNKVITLPQRVKINVNTVFLFQDGIQWYITSLDGCFFSAPCYLYATFVVRKMSLHGLCQSLSVLSLLTLHFFVFRADKTTRLLNKCFAADRTDFSLWSRSSPEKSLWCGKISLYSFRGVTHTKTCDETCPTSLRGVTDMK